MSLSLKVFKITTGEEVVDAAVVIVAELGVLGSVLARGFFSLCTGPGQLCLKSLHMELNFSEHEPQKFERVW